MKDRVSYILSSILLLSFIGQLLITSSTGLFSDENSEETYEIGLEDLFDDEVDDETKICSFDWIIIESNDSELFNEFHNSSLFLLGKYSLIDRSIPVPPPEKMV